MEIELLKKTIKKTREEKRLKDLVVKILFGLIFCLAGAMICLSLYNLTLWARNKTMEQQKSTVKQKITDLNQVEMKQTYLLDKLTSFKDLLKLQKRHQAVAETIFALIPDGTSLKGFDIDESGAVNLSGTVVGWEQLSELFSRIRQTETEKLRVLTAQVNKISFSADSRINFDIDLQLFGGNGNR